MIDELPYYYDLNSYNKGIQDSINLFKRELNDELLGNTFIIDFLEKLEKLKK